ncbi:RabGAP/TBC [Metschnikowia bicuspidata var. bicuspidata NRRL YB-4993]|uniref:RabGAP/TBC n=1 Tax=Metschnikowia bicuspidata var. bicuspidata NRRL YB-4993 TaxID=869754 RepID=A0A1A0HDP0_9ASCO|nr:RabGAP/TBC [Metschnikowia bicuspidata var. bicuspidata NRRL YB-4993]OBA22199.1 RabGAP/TBC [Metschnikowia bicuspidata var. bicuspidata NRRL YB-4993]
MLKENEVISKVLLSVSKFKGNFAEFRQGILLGDYDSKSKEFSRLLLWKTCLITKTLNTREWKDKLKTCRVIYHELRKSSNIIVPWWRLDEDNEFFMVKPSSKIHNLQTEPQKSLRFRNVTDDPLTNTKVKISRKETSETNQDDAELLKTIILDVQRLFPGDPVFHSHNDASLRHKRQVVSILFIWSKCNPQAGYKQGLHEVLGLIYKNILKESLALPNTNTLSVDDLNVLSLFDLHYLEHDSFFLFNKFVVGTGIVSQFYESEAVLMISIERFNSFLMKVDQLIHYNLITKLKLDTQLWIIRFFRLILLRELGNDLEISSSFWDKLAAVGASSLTQCVPQLISFSIIVFLIHLKAELALCDFAEALSLLLHYPISTRLNLFPNFINDLFEDALKLFQMRENDLKLYELGLKLNKKYAGVLKVNANLSTVVIPSTLNEEISSGTLTERPLAETLKKSNMAFEKSRLELRLKRKAQLILNNTD